MSTTLQVFKITRNCPGCKKKIVTYRLKHQLGASQSFCSKDCAYATAKNGRIIELVDMSDVPNDWQKQLEDKAAKIEERLNGAN